MDKFLRVEPFIRSLVHIHRAARLHPSDELALAKDDLEGLIGRTVSRSVAGRLLGVSATAVDNWVAAGEIPVVLTPGGRRGVPVAELVDMLEEVDRRRAAGGDRYPLSRVLRDRRVRARAALAGLDLSGIAPESSRGHRAADVRSLAFHRAVVRRLDERMLTEARARLGRWRREGAIDERWARQWSDLLALRVEDLARSITRDDEETAQLRQSSPFAGSLNHQERAWVLQLVRDAA
jgi:hypothetical protein